MSKESRKYRVVDDYLRKVGLTKIEDIYGALVKEVGEERANRFIDDFNRFYDTREDQTDDNYSSDFTELHDLLKKERDISRIVESYYDADIIRESCCWILEHKDSIGDNALDIGCGSGVITCFAATIRPDVHFVGVDRSKNSIDRAIELAEILELKNVEFQFGDISKKENSRYSTVFSFRTLQENLTIGNVVTWFFPFDDQVNTYKNIFNDYVSIISSYVETNGNVISIERIVPDVRLLGLLLNYNNNGLGYKETKEIECKEANETSRLVAIVVDKVSCCSEEELVEKWSSVAFNHGNEEDYTESQSDYYLQEYEDGLITGYNTYDELGNQNAKCGLYKVKENPGKFIMYQSNTEKKSLVIYPIERLNEAKELFRNDIENFKTAGYRIELL